MVDFYFLQNLNTFIWYLKDVYCVKIHTPFNPQSNPVRGIHFVTKYQGGEN